MACTHRDPFPFLCIIPANTDLSANLFGNEALVITSFERMASKEEKSWPKVLI
jgi:hypothetical protein